MGALSDFVSGGGIISKYEEFTTSGTWTKDPAATWVYVECIGGGGGGADRSASFPGDANGGAGGEFLSRIFTASDLSASETVTVGSGGLGGNDSGGSSGGNSAFGSYLTALGANGGGQSASITSMPRSSSGDIPSADAALFIKHITFSQSSNGGSRTLRGGNCIYGGAGGGGTDGGGRGLGGSSEFGGNGGDGNLSLIHI